MDPSATASSAAMGGAARPGVLRQLRGLEDVMGEHARQLARHEEMLNVKKGDEGALAETLRQEVRDAIADVRTEILHKLTAVTAEIRQIQRQLNVQKGEANILSQQNKDASKRISELAEQVQQLSIEIVGDEAFEDA